MKKADVEKLEAENARLRHYCKDLHWMARRYADGRNTYAPSIVNEATRYLLSIGASLNPCGEEIIWARDGMGRDFDKLSPQQATPGTPEAMGLA